MKKIVWEETSVEMKRGRIRRVWLIGRAVHISGVLCGVSWVISGSDMRTEGGGLGEVRDRRSNPPRRS